MTPNQFEKIKRQYNSTLKLNNNLLSKTQVIQTELPKIINYLKKEENTDFEKCLHNELYQEIKQFEMTVPKLYLKWCTNYLDSDYKKRTRLLNRVKNMINKKCIFLTFTFTDESLASSTSDDRRRYVRRYLNMFSDVYVANIDFGDPIKYTGREHYHAIIQANSVDYSKWKYGSINGEIVYASSKSPEKLSLYINKLTNHAIKDSTTRQHLIYSKNKGDLNLNENC